MTKTTTYHVYADDGFESSHRSLEAASRAAYPREGRAGRLRPRSRPVADVW